jgi:hypothetical protein
MKRYFLLFDVSDAVNSFFISFDTIFLLSVLLCISLIGFVVLFSEFCEFSRVFFKLDYFSVSTFFRNNAYDT